jgi:hypothetical protein
VAASPVRLNATASRWQPGRHLLTLSPSQFDPNETSAVYRRPQQLKAHLTLDTAALDALHKEKYPVVPA